MTVLEKIVEEIKKIPLLYSLLIVSFYISRFLLASVRERSLWFYRYQPGHFGPTIPSRRYIEERKNEIFTG